MSEQFKSGFIAILGSPNVGKSTLMNSLIGQKVSIVSGRAQTTRTQIKGVLTRQNYQMIFIDTPGIQTPNNKLGEFMLKTAYSALAEVEAVLFVVDPVNGLRERDESILNRIKTVKAPVVAVVNKTDIASEGAIAAVMDRLAQEDWLTKVVQISAHTGQGVFELEPLLKTFMTDGPQYFPDDMVTDQPERLICAEMIREAALDLLNEEVPHGIGVEIDKMQERAEGELMDVWATIYCERPGHKGIIIGKNGAMLKQIGIKSRKEMQWLLGEKVNLQLWIKVRENWRNKAMDLRMLGYEKEK